MRLISTTIFLGPQPPLPFLLSLPLWNILSSHQRGLSRPSLKCSSASRKSMCDGIQKLKQRKARGKLEWRKDRLDLSEHI